LPKDRKIPEEALGDALQSLNSALIGSEVLAPVNDDSAIFERLIGRLEEDLRPEEGGSGAVSGSVGGKSEPPEPEAATVSQPRRHRAHRKGVMRAMALVVAVVVVAGVSLSINALSRSPGPAPSVNASPSWRLVSSATSPFRSLPPGAASQPNIQCVSDTVCYLTNPPDDAILYRTTDGGLAWSQSTTPFPMTGHNLSCSSANTCGAVGMQQDPGGIQSPTLALTDDGGRQWRTANIPTPSGVRDPHYGAISCVGELRCVIYAWGGKTPVHGAFLTTPDGGASWSQGAQLSGPTSAPTALTCTSDGSCIALSQTTFTADARVVALHSANWGATWQLGAPAKALDRGLLNQSCGDANHCIVLNGDGTGHFDLSFTSNGGATWHTSGLPAGWLNVPTAIDCANGSDCWVAMSEYDVHSPLGGYSRPNIEMTRNGGASWSSIRLPSHQPAIADVLDLSCPPSGNGCLAVGNLADHMVLPKNRNQPLSGPLLLSSLPSPRS
jgi:photosystem II stability/assembly factor-like uncharacterized protein